MRGCLITVCLAIAAFAFSVPAVFTAPQPRNPTGDYWVPCRTAATTLLGGRLSEDEPGVVYAETRGPDVALPIAARVANATCSEAAVRRLGWAIAVGLGAFVLSLWAALRLEPHIVDE